MTSGENKEAMDWIDPMGQALMTLEDYYDKMTSATINKGMHRQGNNMTAHATLQQMGPMHMGTTSAG